MPANHWPAMAAGVLLATALASGFALADDAGTPPATLDIEQASLADLENTFWVCDYVASTEGVVAALRATCRYVTEEVKRQKFDGDFNQFLQWWRDNKAAEHARIKRIRQS
jgi:hypothetical protein